MPSAESGLLRLVSGSAAFPAQPACAYGENREPRHRFRSCPASALPGNGSLIESGQHQIPIGRAPPKPRRSIPRFPPSRFIQRLPTGARAQSIAIAVGQTSNKPKPFESFNAIRFFAVSKMRFRRREPATLGTQYAEYEATRHTRSEKWTNVGGFVHPFATLDGQKENRYVVDFV